MKSRRFSRFSFLLLLILLHAGLLQADSHRIPLRGSPSSDAAIVTVLVRGLSLDLLEISGNWCRIRQGDSAGWVRLDELIRMPDPAPDSFSSAATHGPDFSPAAEYSGWQESDGLVGLIDFAIEDRELKRKMSHPSYRHRINQVSRSWGPLFYRRTHYYYVKGIHFLGLAGGDLRLSLVKRRIFYKEIFGSLWSDDALRMTIDSNKGWLSNREIFGKGREYYIEASLHF